MHRYVLSFLAIFALSACGEKSEYGKVSKEIDGLAEELIEIIEGIENREDAENAKEEVINLYERLEVLTKEQEALFDDAPDDVIRKYNWKQTERKSDLTGVMEKVREKFKDDAVTYALVVNLLLYADKNNR